jgi:uncharacterized protein YecT (DUF1311 family)
MNKKRPRQVWVPVLVLASSSIACSLALSAPIDCSLANDDEEKTICSHPSLTAQDKAISDRLDALGRECPSLRPLLMQGQKYWLRERRDCRSEEGVVEKAEGLATCLARRMAQRLQRLNDEPQSCDPKPLIGGYRFVDPVYLLRYGDQYIGKTVSVFGSIDLDNCRASGTGTLTGSIVGNSPRHERYRAVFSAMSEEARESLCAQHPAAHWQGVVRQDKRGSYLFLSE